MPQPILEERAFKKGLEPDPQETVSEWAEKYMVLSSEASEQGKFRTARAPFMREIMDELSPLSPIREVVFMKCVQITGTTAGLCWLGHTIHRAPTNMMIVEPTVDLAKKVSKQRVKPLIEEVEPLRGLVQDARARDSSNTMFEKEFTGGRLVLTGANSGVGLRFMAVKNLMLDEVDAYPYDVDGEGPPIDIVEKRTATYPRYKIFKLSTPLIKQTSVIEPAYENSDQRRYFVPCPHCDHGQHLEWSRLTWPKDKPREAAYECSQCGELIKEHFKSTMLEQGAWFTTADAAHLERLAERIAGFHINILYQPYGWRYNWPFLAMAWTKITRSNDQGKLKTFINTLLAQTWNEAGGGEKIEHSTLHNRREFYPAPVPKQVKLITAGADLQKDRIEAEKAGWGKGEECWMLEKRIFPGDTDNKQDPCWTELDQWLSEGMQGEDGALKYVQGLCFDTGYLPQAVYAFIKPRQVRRFFATKGTSQPGATLIYARTKLPQEGIWLISIGTDAAKDSIYSRLQLPLDQVGPTYIHFPIAPEYEEDHFSQLCAEVKVPKPHKGVVVGSKYQKLQHRNEALDLMVLNFAALQLIDPLRQILEGENQPQPVIQEPEPGPEREERGGSWIRPQRGWLIR